MKVFSLLSPDSRRNLLFLFAAGLLFWSSLASLLPVLPLYIKSVGANDQWVGITMGAFAIGLLCVRGQLAKLADARGRKLVLLIGILAVLLAPLGYAMTTSIPVLIGLRAFHGISIAAFALAYSALVVDLSPPQHRGEVIGYMSLVNPIGVALGPAIGGFSQAWLGYVPMFLISSALGVLGLLFTMQVREVRDADTSANSAKASQFWGLLLTPRIRIPALVLLLIGITFGTLSTFVPLYIKEAGVSLNAGLFYTTAATASFGIRLLTGRASDRYGRGVFITASLVLYTVAMVLLWRASSVTSFLVAGFVEGAGAGILIPMIAALMADRSRPDERGRTFGVCMIGFDAGIAMAGPIFGSLALSIGYRGIFGLAAILAFTSIGVFLTQSGKDLPQSLGFALGRRRDSYAIDPALVKS